MTIDATFWVAISFFIFLGILIYLKVPQKINSSLIDQINKIKKELDEAEGLKVESKNLLSNYENKIDKSVKETKKIIYQAKNDCEKIILEKIKSAEEDLSILRASCANDTDNGTEDTSPTFKAFEEGSTTLSKEENTKLAERQAKFIVNLNHALIRLENNSYGMCRITGKLISKERLTLVPHATLSIEAKKAQ